MCIRDSRKALQLTAYKHTSEVKERTPSTRADQNHKGRPEHRELRALLFSNGAWVLLRPAELRDGAYGLSSLSDKTRKSNHLQI